MRWAYPLGAARNIRRRHYAGAVQIITGDYRELTVDSVGVFDKIVSVGMFEHVGPRNYRTFMQTIRPLLAETGLFLCCTPSATTDQECAPTHG